MEDFPGGMLISEISPCDLKPSLIHASFNSEQKKTKSSLLLLKIHLILEGETYL
jgi:hypothetical protein